MWYAAERFTAWVERGHGAGAYEALIDSDPVAQRDARTWNRLVNGGRYVSLPIADRIACELGLHLTMLGDPDLYNGRAPQAVGDGVPYDVAVTCESPTQPPFARTV